MFRNKNIVYLILILGLAIIFILERKKFDSTLTELENPESLATEAKKTVPNPLVSTGTSALAEPESTSITAELNKITIWLTTEAANLEKSTSDQTAKDAELKQIAESLNPSEAQYLRNMAVNPKATANERILSTYVLSLGSKTTEILAVIAQENLSLPSPQPVHSTAETLLMQEKAIRTMAIDEFFKRATLNSSLKNAFFQMANQIQDPGLKNYALRRFSELK
ncbi:MAG: hypothetical protein WA160_09940 [Pseudobdellovibrio sp.]